MIAFSMASQSALRACAKAESTASGRFFAAVLGGEVAGLVPAVVQPRRRPRARRIGLQRVGQPLLTVVGVRRLAPGGVVGTSADPGRVLPLKSFRIRAGISPTSLLANNGINIRTLPLQRCGMINSGQLSGSRGVRKFNSFQVRTPNMSLTRQLPAIFITVPHPSVKRLPGVITDLLAYARTWGCLRCPVRHKTPLGRRLHETHT